MCLLHCVMGYPSKVQTLRDGRTKWMATGPRQILSRRMRMDRHDRSKKRSRHMGSGPRLAPAGQPNANESQGGWSTACVPQSLDPQRQHPTSVRDRNVVPTTLSLPYLTPRSSCRTQCTEETQLSWHPLAQDVCGTPMRTVDEARGFKSLLP